MYKKTSILQASILGLVINSAVIAQDEQSGPVDEPMDLTEKGYQDSQTGLKVEERRYENRLDGVTIERENSRVQDYYNLTDPDIERREGGILEGGAMRTWRLGGSK